MQRFVKYCKKEHNIQLGCNTIHTGTLHYYRGKDPNFSIASIADQNEGKETVLVPDYDSEKATPDARQFFNHGNGRLVMKNCVVENHFPNSLIFCMSFDPGSNYLEEAHKFEYDSYYIITDINLFAYKLADIIMEHFKISWFDSNYRSLLEQFSISDYKQIILEFRHQPIKYVKRKREIVSGSKLTKRPENQDIIERIVFTKEENYKEDKEYRILFYFKHPRFGVIPVRKDPAILPISPLSMALLSSS